MKLKLSDIKVSEVTGSKIRRAGLLGMAGLGMFAMTSCSDPAECSDFDSVEDTGQSADPSDIADPANEGRSCRDSD